MVSAVFVHTMKVSGVQNNIDQNRTDFQFMDNIFFFKGLEQQEGKKMITDFHFWWTVPLNSESTKG